MTLHWMAWEGDSWNLLVHQSKRPIQNPYRSLNQRCHFSGSEACLSIAGPVHPAPCPGTTGEGTIGICLSTNQSGPIRNPYRSLNQRCHFSGSEACLSIAGPVHPNHCPGTTVIVPPISVLMPSLYSGQSKDLYRPARS
ncbi:hypothetical protein CEXT_345931 [Caerostris extrusa]|uniref:Uncharacterized protein n=1 Tax=Caerostris extrusa TaxID=172846 RepID=A0AAV4TCR2_CAEEX|nr:hypothetical protein CEXT_345931 [Caerostris extrusa]